MRGFRDINSDVPNVGDIILYSQGSYIAKAYVLGFTKQGFYISDEENRYGSSAIEFHNRKKYKQWLSFMILERNKVIPELLIPHCKMSQIPV